mgnify:CR=1 FL=1
MYWSRNAPRSAIEIWRGDLPASKSLAAASLHVSRAVFYDRLAKVEKVLGADLNDPDIRVSLHVALLAEELAEELTGPA